MFVMKLVGAHLADCVVVVEAVAVYEVDVQSEAYVWVDVAVAYSKLE